jgi:hypothetical protein
MNQFIDNFLRATLWIWLPFFAFFMLLKQVEEKLRK